MEQGLTKNNILSELSRSPHGKLTEYVPTTTRAAKEEPEFLAHLIAWNHKKGQIRDSKVAIPVISILEKSYPEELVENSLAHLADLGPRELLKSFKFAETINTTKKSGLSRKLRKLITSYLRELEAEPFWDRVAIQHRGTLRELYAQSHTKPGTERVNIVLYGRDYNKVKHSPPKGSVFEAAHLLPKMSDIEAAGTIMEWKIPFLIAQGALKDRIKKPDIFLAMLNRMSPTELITNAPWMIEEYDLKNNLAVKGAFDEAMKKAQKSTANVLKTTRAAESIKDESLKANLRGLQDKQLSSMGVEGNWLVLGDKSTSMTETIEMSRQVAGTLAKMVKGKVWLVYFDTTPQSINVTGLALDKINDLTKYVQANGATSIGCGLQRLLEMKEEVDGIAVVSDAQENSYPWFASVYKQYIQVIGKEIPVYLYRTVNNSNWIGDRDLRQSMKSEGYDVQEFDLTRKVDYYSLPNLVATMRTNRYSLIDEVMATSLMTFKDVFKHVFKHVTFNGKEVKV